jgi:hypothetical protein
MTILERMYETGKKVVASATLLGMVSCAAPTLLEGERLRETNINISNKSISYKMTEAAQTDLMIIAGIRNGTVQVYKNSDGHINSSGIGPSILSRSFQQAYREADTDGNGIVDTPESEALYKRTVEESLKE